MGLHGRNFFEPFSDDGSVSSFERRWFDRDSYV